MRVRHSFLAAAISIFAFPLLAAQTPEPARLPDVDKRLQAVGDRALEPEREAAVKEMKRRINRCEVHIDPLLQTPKFVYRKGRTGFLTKPDPAFEAVPPQAVPAQIVPPRVRLNPVAVDHERPVRNFLAQHAAAFGHGA